MEVNYNLPKSQEYHREENISGRFDNYNLILFPDNNYELKKNVRKSRIRVSNTFAKLFYIFFSLALIINILGLKMDY